MAVTIDLSGDLAGVGQRLTSATGAVGGAVAGGADLNADGVSDIVVGGTDGAFIVYGGADAFAAPVDLDSPGDGGVRLTGAAPASFAFGDFNGDGGTDLLAGLFGVYGDPDLPDTVDLTAIDDDGFTIEPAEEGDGAGRVVVALGDLDRDGYDDFVIGAPDGDTAYLVLGDGRLSEGIALYMVVSIITVHHFDPLPVAPDSVGVLPPPLELGTEDTTTLFTTGVGGGLGRWLASGDINGDGAPDILIAAPDAHAGNGAVHIVFGATWLPAEINVDTLTPDAGFTLVGRADERLGSALALLGDVNGDGIDDFAAAGTGSASTAYVIFGGPDLGPIDLGNLGGAGFRITGAGARDAIALSAAGDFNGDGLGDILLAPGPDSDAYVVFGRAGGGDVDLATLGNDEGVAIAVRAGDGEDQSVAAAGDVNDDGIDDILIGNAADGAAYVVFGFTAVAGTDDDDTLAGTNAGADVVDGGDGDNELSGDVGGDTLIGAAGADTLMGGAGSDLLSGGGADDALWGQAGDDVIDGDEGDDRLFGNDGDDNMSGGTGDDSLRGQTGADTLDGGVGLDEMFGGDGGDSLDGGADADTLNGNSGDDTVRGGESDDIVRGQFGNDELDGGNGNDLLVGGGDADRLDGGDGDDTLIGGPGDDTLTGGDGADLFEFGLGQGDNLVTDFADGIDRLRLAGVGGQADLVVEDGADGARVALASEAGDPTVTITLTGIGANQVTADDFLFG